MIEQGFRPVYSKRWLGRRFVLTETSLRWGRYSIAAPEFATKLNHRWEALVTMLREADPESIASKFEFELEGCAHQDYLAEIGALFTYQLSRKHLDALHCIECTANELEAARSAVATTFQYALLAVFNSAAQVHGLGRAHKVRYSQILHGQHHTEVFVQEKLYRAAFSPDLILESVWDDFQMWPPLFL
jgi:hypothetical protein